VQPKPRTAADSDGQGQLSSAGQRNSDERPPRKLVNGRSGRATAAMIRKHARNDLGGVQRRPPDMAWSVAQFRQTVKAASGAVCLGMARLQAPCHRRAIPPDKQGTLTVTHTYSNS
jgi:hypothetical protein